MKYLSADFLILLFNLKNNFLYKKICINARDFNSHIPFKIDCGDVIVISSEFNHRQYCNKPQVARSS